MWILSWQMTATRGLMRPRPLFLKGFVALILVLVLAPGCTCAERYIKTFKPYDAAEFHEHLWWQQLEEEEEEDG